MKHFDNKVAVVTGAGSGIGQALARELDALGCRLAISDVNTEGLKATAADLKSPHFSEQLDVADREAVYAHASNVARELGDADIVINNAGVALAQTIEDMSYEDFEWVMDINFWGMVYGSKAFLPQLKKKSEAAIANVSSVFGLFAVPTQSAYNASKFAIRGFTEALRQEMAGTGLQVHSIHPGGIRTNIAAASRFYVGPDGSRDAKGSADRFQKIARTTPEQAAKIILRGIRRNDPRILVGTDAIILDKLQRAMPLNYSRLTNVLLKKA